MQKFISTVILASIVVTPALVAAEEASDACAQAQVDAKHNTSNALWFLAGCLFNVFGVGAAYLIEPSPSAMGLLGKSSEYVAAYTDCYREAGRKQQTNMAITGCLVDVAFSATLTILSWLLSGGIHFAL